MGGGVSISITDQLGMGEWMGWMGGMGGMGSGMAAGMAGMASMASPGGMGGGMGGGGGWPPSYGALRSYHSMMPPSNPHMRGGRGAGMVPTRVNDVVGTVFSTEAAGAAVAATNQDFNQVRRERERAWREHGEHGRARREQR